MIGRDDQEYLGFSNPDRIVVDANVKEFLVEMAADSPEGGHILCVYYFKRFSSIARDGITSSRGPGVDVGWYSKDQVPSIAIKTLKGVSVAFRMKDPEASYKLSVARTAERMELNCNRF